MKQSNQYNPEVQEQLDGYVEDLETYIETLAYEVRRRASKGFFEDEELDLMIEKYKGLVRNAVSMRDRFMQDMQGYRKDK